MGVFQVPHHSKWRFLGAMHCTENEMVFTTFHKTKGALNGDERSGMDTPFAKQANS
jgi:hypothetical protein